MGWFAVLLLVKFKPPSWFYFIRYSWWADHGWGWEHSVKVWWVTRLKSKVSRPLFSLVIVAGNMMSCGWKHRLGWGEELSEKGSVKQTIFCLVISFSAPNNNHAHTIFVNSYLITHMGDLNSSKSVTSNIQKFCRQKVTNCIRIVLLHALSSAICPTVDKYIP